MCITAACFLFLLKLRWPKSKSICDHVLFKTLRKICSVLRLSAVFTLESLPDQEERCSVFLVLRSQVTNAIIGAKCNKGPKCNPKMVLNVIRVPNIKRNWRQT